MKIIRNDETQRDEANQVSDESIASAQLSQLNDKERYFLGLMKKADTTNKPIEELLALSYITQFKNPEVSKARSKERL